MADHPNVAIVRRSLEAANRGDMQAATEALADDVVWHEIGRDEPIRGKDALAALYAGAASADFQITAEEHDILANDEHTVALITATVTRNGRTFTYRVAEIYHVKDGKVTERWAFSDDTAAITEFFS